MSQFIKAQPFSLAKIFSDNMVLQRDKEIRIWGTGSDNLSIIVTLGDHQAVVNPLNGQWEVFLPPMPATTSCELRVTSSDLDEQIIIQNVAIGEVWIAGGQSNMEFRLKYDEEAEDVLVTADNPSIRFFDVPKVSYEGQECDEDYSEFGFWRVCNPTNASYFSAVGFYFAMQIYKSLNVPIGIVGCNWGGTTASTWVSEADLESDEDLRIYLREYAEATRDLDVEQYDERFKQAELGLQSPEGKAFMEMLLTKTVSMEEISAYLLPKYALIGPKSENRPAGLYNTMVKQIAGFAARGVIWYQGESDGAKAGIYDKLFSAVIRRWRDVWNDELPFLFVQLAPFGTWMIAHGGHYPIVRAQQEKVSKMVPKAYMASIMDAGMEFDIHPKNKRPVGERLALLARGKVYGENIVCEAPEVEHVTKTGTSLKIKFCHAGEGLVVKGDRINGLQLLINEEEINEFDTDVQDDLLLIRSDKINQTDKIEVRFAWMDYVKVNLYSSAGLPAKPFIKNL
ncbi:hypothetical protein J7E73_29305 [Paenibacillus albidus]|uniref:sialate O-acetylesterase n=1 Tax=Paenibacillus albidus TaxID=2041023 RepID=UPI001BE628DC|nr:sialate O-acetylesterase [Paenibacillus albidus]MBT2293139.1 hypothetical protein [Paenibacillus albidus]